jgi:8-oxo-dGTP pyrophosphatase MutT (NUDIX family)
MNNNVLYDNQWFSVIEIKDSNGTMIGIEPKDDNILILPYITDDKKNLVSLGLRHEANALRKGGFSDTIISGDVEETETFLDAAKRELAEESGYNVEDNDRFQFVGKITTSKLVKQEHPCFLVDITDIKQGKIKGDGTEGEKASKFKLVTPSEIIKSNDSLVLTLFFKYFLINFHDIF